MSEVAPPRAPLVTPDLLKLAITLLEVPHRELQGWLAQNSPLRVVSVPEASVDATVTLNDELEPIVAMTPLPELDGSVLETDASNENRQAVWVYRALVKRQESLAKLLTLLMGRMRRELYRAALPLPRFSTLDLASALEVHESTVRRLTLAKRIATPRGDLSLEDLVHHEPELPRQCSAAQRPHLRSLIPTSSSRAPPTAASTSSPSTARIRHNQASC